MLESAVIDKNKPLLSSQDYNALREEGIRHIQSLSGKIWTDHNLHDPGITTLEILCYALTDLGYRTGFDIKDLLSSENTALDPIAGTSLFPSHEVLTTSPLTITDYRKLLLNIEGVRNAWLEPMLDPDVPGNYKLSEVQIYADCLKDELSYSNLNSSNAANTQVDISGLYKVLLELDIDNELGSLNESNLDLIAIKKGPLKGIRIILDAEADPSFKQSRIDFSEDFKRVEDVTVLDEAGDVFNLRVKIRLQDNKLVTLSPLIVRITDDRPDPELPPIVTNQSKIKNLVKDSSPDSPVALFWKKQQKIKSIIAKVCCALDANRNLTEDYLSINTVGSDDIGICVDIRLEPDADIELVNAQLVFAIEEYFNPRINYFSLQEMLSDGYGVDEIFNGPYINRELRCDENTEVFTQSGFIKTQQLDESELKRTIYASDLINLINDIPGIVSITNLLLQRYTKHGIPVGDAEEWCIDILSDHQPFLNIEHSKITFYKEGLPFYARQREFENTLEQLRVDAKKEAYVEPNQILPVPRGSYRDTEQFYSVQHDFPQTYGIGEARLPMSVDNKRLAKAKQFKGYLLFFDQLLANYLSQLGNIKTLFSLDKNIEQSYFSRFITDVAGVRGEFKDELYTGNTDLSNDKARNLISEDESLAFKRRNQVLDHLLARFSESFTDYVLLMFTFDGDAINTSKNAISGKIDFLENYPILSRGRGKGFNYRQSPTGIWNTDNVAGLKKRISYLLGIADIKRRSLGCKDVFDNVFEARQSGGDFFVRVVSGSEVLFESQELFSTAEDALDTARKLVPCLEDESSYEIEKDDVSNTYGFRITSGSISLTNSFLYNSREDALDDIYSIFYFYQGLLHDEEGCNTEGFHLIEHLLLRPRKIGDELLDICLGEPCMMCGDEDPYSFRISVILPAYPYRFRNMDFRRFFEKKLREECPAHIHVKICWINNKHMLELDRHYRAWLTGLKNKKADPDKLRAKQKRLIRLLKLLKSVYPPTTLHDCEDDGDDQNPVVLGSTSLGVF